MILKTNFKGMTQRYINTTGSNEYYFLGIKENAKAPATQRPAIIALFDEVRAFMQELSPQLGVTDPGSGNIFSKVGYHDR